MDWGITHRDGSSQKSPHGNGQDWTFKGRNARKFGAVVGKGPADVIPHDRKVVTKEKVLPVPPSVLQAARESGVSVKSYLAMARLDVYLKAQ
jgi:hypothetical protein